MNKKTLYRIRGAATSVVGLMVTIVYSIILKNLPTYFDECRMLTVTAKIAIIIALFTLVFGIANFFIGGDGDDESANTIYCLMAISGFYEIVFAYYYLRARILGIHHFITFSDNIGVLLSSLSILMIIVLCLMKYPKYRRLVFENKSWRNKDDNSIIEHLSGFVIKFSVVMLAVIFGVEGLNCYRFKPSGEENGFSYIDLKLPSGKKWANQNFYSKSISDLGIELRLEQTASHTFGNADSYPKEDVLSFLTESDDIVSEFMDGDWHIPTQQDWEELLSECKARPAFYKGVYGVSFKKPFILKRLFLPAGELYRWNETSYWSSTVIPNSDMEDNEDYYNNEYDLDYEYDHECNEEYGECTCDECNCWFRIEKEEEEIEDYVETDYIEAFIVSIYSVDYHPESFLQVDISSSYDECHIRPVTY